MSNIEFADAATERKIAPNLQDYLRVLFRFKWGIVGLALIGAGIFGLRAYSETPIYQATSLLLIERQAPKYLSIDSVYQSSGYDFGEYYQTQYEVLKSRPIAERVVKSIGAEAFLTDPNADTSFSLRKLIPWLRPPENKPPSAPDLYEMAVNTVKGTLQVHPIRNSQLVRLQFEGPNPELITKMSNALGSAYIEEMLEGKLQMAQAASSWLTERLSGLQDKVEASEKTLQDFRDRERMIEVKGVDSLAAQELSRATERLADARRDRMDAESTWRQVQSAKQQGTSLESIQILLRYPLVSELKQSVVAADGELRKLAQRYGEKHPSMVEAKNRADSARNALSRQLEETVVGIERELQSAQNREQLLQSEFGSAKGQVAGVNRKQYELMALEREVESNRQIYDLFQTRSKETTATSGVQSANARLVEAAMVPGAPILPNKQRAILMGLLFGLLFGVGMAFLLDHLDNTLKGAEDVERRLNVPVLGLLPKLKVSSKDDHSPMRSFIDASKSSFTEAVRTIRTSVLLSAIDQPHKRILITSSVPGEGKTTLSMNLALALGQMNKVLLIDADMRRPAVHRGLKDHRHVMGLTQFISGEAPISECLHKIEGSNVYVMKAGAVPPNPLEILSSAKFESVLESLSKAFDNVIIDCAPACAVSDALMLSRLVHAVVYVVRSDSTPWQLAEQGIKRLRRVNAPLLGVVVNHVSASKNRYGTGKYYYYGDSYYSDYGYGTTKSGT